jgi:hypothetical protein
MRTRVSASIALIFLHDIRLSSSQGYSNPYAKQKRARSGDCSYDLAAADGLAETARYHTAAR